MQKACWFIWSACTYLSKKTVFQVRALSILLVIAWCLATAEQAALSIKDALILSSPISCPSCGNYFFVAFLHFFFCINPSFVVGIDLVPFFKECRIHAHFLHYENDGVNELLIQEGMISPGKKSVMSWMQSWTFNVMLVGQ